MRLVVPLKFWTFYDVISPVYNSVWKIVVDLIIIKGNEIIRIDTNDNDSTLCGRRVKNTCLIFVLGILC